MTTKVWTVLPPQIPLQCTDSLHTALGMHSAELDMPQVSVLVSSSGQGQERGCHQPHWGDTNSKPCFPNQSSGCAAPFFPLDNSKASSMQPLGIVLTGLMLGKSQNIRALSVWFLGGSKSNGKPCQSLKGSGCTSRAS